MHDCRGCPDAAPRRFFLFSVRLISPSVPPLSLSPPALLGLGRIADACLLHCSGSKEAGSRGASKGCGGRREQQGGGPHRKRRPAAAFCGGSRGGSRSGRSPRCRCSGDARRYPADASRVEAWRPHPRFALVPSPPPPFRPPKDMRKAKRKGPAG